MYHFSNAANYAEKSVAITSDIPPETLITHTKGIKVEHLKSHHVDARAAELRPFTARMEEKLKGDMLSHGR